MTDASLHAHDAYAERPMWPALRRGWARRCPSCGSGPLLRGYLNHAVNKGHVEAVTVGRKLLAAARA